MDGGLERGSQNLAALTRKAALLDEISQGLALEVASDRRRHYAGRGVTWRNQTPVGLAKGWPRRFRRNLLV